MRFSDFGFDPLGLGEVPENLERFKESELIHCRWAMLAVVSHSLTKKIAMISVIGLIYHIIYIHIQVTLIIYNMLQICSLGFCYLKH